MKSIQDLRAERTAKAKEARNILDNRTWDDAAKKDIDALYADIARLDDQIEAVERQLKIESNSLDTRARVAADRSGNSEDAEARRISMETDIFRAFLAGGNRAVAALGDEHQALIAERRNAVRADQSVGTGSQGGYLVPREFGERILTRIAAFGGMRAVADNIRTDHGRAIDYPTTDVSSEVGEIVAENTQASADSVSFGTIALLAFKFSSKTLNVPLELIQDSAFDIVDHIEGRFAARFARAQNNYFTTGTGTSQPQGAVTAAGLGKTGAVGQTTSVTYDDFVDLEHSIDPAYRSAAACRYMFHDTTLKAVKKLKDTTGRPLWRPGVTGADANDILGYGYTINQSMAPMAANAKSILFGDFKRYMIRDVLQMLSFRFTDSKYMEKGQVGFLAWARADGRLIDASNDGIKYYANSAT